MYDVLHAFISNSNLKIVVDHCLLKYLTVHKTLSTFFADFSSCLLHKIYWLNYNWTGIFTIKTPSKKSKKEIKNFQKIKKRNQKFSKLKKKEIKNSKKPEKSLILTVLTAHLITYVCIEITMMFLYSLVTRNIIHWSLISNYMS